MKLFKRKREVHQNPKTVAETPESPWGTCPSPQVLQARVRRDYPLLSVVLPVYNQAQYLPESIRSVLHATRGALELIVIDDGSSDNVDAALKEFSGDSRLRLIRQGNQGLSRALNRGFNEARGNFLTWTSADNRYLPGALDALADCLLLNPRAGLVYANMSLIDELGKPLHNSNYRKENQMPPGSPQLILPRETSTLFYRSDNFIGACFLYRRSVVDAVGRYNPELLGFEDFDYWLRIGEQFEIKHIPSDAMLYEYRLHRKSLTSILEPNQLAQSSHTHRAARLESKLRKSRKFQFTDQSPGGRATRVFLSTLHLPVEPLLPTENALSRSLPKYEGLNTWGQISFEDSKFLCFEIQSEARPQLRHALHSRFLEPTLTNPLLLVTASALSKGSELDARAALASPPLLLPPLLRRARDGSFGAVTPDHLGGTAFLIFAPGADSEGADQLSELIAQLLELLPETTLVLYAETNSERTFADNTYSSALRNRTGKNLRIIDTTPELDRDQPLLFALSSVDAVLSLPTDLTSWSALVELRIEAGLSAMAGKPMITLNQDPCLKPSFGIFQSTAQSPEQVPKPSVLPHLFPIPHLKFVDLSSHWKPLTSQQPRQNSLAAVKNQLTTLIPPLPRDTYEQWLETCSAQHIGEQVKKFLSS